MSQEPLVRDADVAAFRAAVLAKLTYSVGKDPDHAFEHDWFEAVALAARDHMVEHWMDHTRQIYRKVQKRVYYLSLEFLIGRLLYDSLSNLGLLEIAREAMTELGVDIERIKLLEPDGIKALVLVTNDMHMPRARAAFEAAAQGRVEIIPAPVSLRRDATSEWSDWCPSNEGFARVRYAVYEWLGLKLGY